MDGWVYGWMQDVLAFEWLDEFYSNSTFKSLNMLDRCQVNMNIPDQKTECPNIAPQNPKRGFTSKTVLMIFIKCLKSTETLHK
jgi:hypothetical protein